MALSNPPVGTAAKAAFDVEVRPNDITVALAGNPNVGKSTVFNGLTGMNQHTGNWPGKTVTNARGRFSTEKHSFVLVDIPGTYSLMAHSAEEETARDFLCFGEPDAVICVCDATCLERNLNLALQTSEICENTVVCVNLLDEAERKGISVDISLLSERLGLPVVGVVARRKSGLAELAKALDKVADARAEKGALAVGQKAECYRVTYPKRLCEAAAVVEAALSDTDCGKIDRRWLSFRLLDRDKTLFDGIENYLGEAFFKNEALTAALEEAREGLLEDGLDGDAVKDMTVTALVDAAKELCDGVVTSKKEGGYAKSDRRIDSFLTGRWTAFPVMAVLLAFVFWLTIVGANYPSRLLSEGLFFIQDRLTDLFHAANAPEWLHGTLVLGVYRVLAWVVSVMLPPMAIFFPLFTLLEDAGYLPRIAYNLDSSFKKCRACGKQALTMCMGFGCNAAGVVGCRIIDSPRERLLAILTNNFVPCNGRFPTMIAIITMFFIGTSGGFFSSVLSAAALAAVIILGVAVTFLMTRFLSATILKGCPSSFTLELPPYRRPQIGKVIVRSIFDRTLFVLGRAVAVAAPAGLVIWLMANIAVGNASLLSHCSAFLDPLARLMGLDGVILMAFILGFPANEIVIPIIIMAYMAEGSILELESLAEMRSLFVANGWTWVTAASTLLFSLFHFPCSTTLITIYRETRSLRYTFISALLPTAVGILLCFLLTGTARLFSP